MSNWKGTYSELRARKLATIGEKDFKDEIALAEMEEEIGFFGGHDEEGNETVHRPSDRQGCQVVSSGRFVSEIGDLDYK